MLPSILNLNTGKTKDATKNVLVSNRDKTICSNRDINKDHKRLPPPEAYKIGIPAVRYDNLKMLAKKYNDEKLAITFLIVGGGLIAYNFW